MNFKDLLLSTAAVDIIAILVKTCNPDEEKREKFEKEHIKFIEKLKTVAPVDSGHLLLGLMYHQDGVDSFDVSLFCKEELMAFNPDSELAAVETIGHLSEEEIERLASIKATPQSYAFEYSPWDEILGYDLNEQNVMDCGAANICAAVIYEMTFFGFTEEAVKEARQELERRAQEVEDALNLPAEKKKEYFISQDEMYERLGIEKPTEEEETALHRESCREHLINKIRTLQVLMRYANG